MVRSASSAHAFGVGQQGLAWVVSAYVLAFGGFLLLGGRLADLVGRRRMFLAGLGLLATVTLIRPSVRAR